MAAFTFSEPQALFQRSEKKSSLLRMFFDAMIQARMTEAKMQVNAHLLSLDDATLAEYGVERAVIKAEGYRSSAI